MSPRQYLAGYIGVTVTTEMSQAQNGLGLPHQSSTTTVPYGHGCRPVGWGGRSVKTCSLSVREAEGIPGGSLLANLAKSGSSERLTLQV